MEKYIITIMKRDKMIIKCPHCGKEIELSMTDPFKDDNDEKE